MTKTKTLPSCSPLLQDLRATSIMRAEDWENLPLAEREWLEGQPHLATLLSELVRRQLLTEYQATRIGIGKSGELILGNYRILDCLGSGGMSVVLKGEHLHLHRLVAIKILNQTPRPELLRRFSSEMRTLAKFQHPNIIAALDAGETSTQDPDARRLHYLVMEYVPGQDLHEQIRTRGPLPAAKACDLGCQIASALGEVHRHGRVHRDVKPANVRVTPDGSAKLLDFGLARDFHAPVTAMHAMLGSLEYMAPEQAADAHRVDIRADIFGLGATLFWCLTGRSPFPMPGNIGQALRYRQSQPPPSVRLCQPGIPEELDSLLMRMMAVNPDERLPAPDAVRRALLPFLHSDTRAAYYFETPPHASEPAKSAALVSARTPHVHRVLITDDEPANRNLCRRILEKEGLVCDEAEDGVAALEALRARPYDMVLLDIDMPRMKGTDVLQQLRDNPPCPYLKVMMLSGRATGDEMAQMLAAGATDYLCKPFSIVQLASRVTAALELKTAQDRSDLLGRNLLTVNQALEKNLHARDSDLVQARNALVLSLAELVAQRDTETGAHLLRLQHYARCLAEIAMTMPSYAGQIDLPFIEMLECCAPLHDIGKAAVPDAILLKPGVLTAEERAVMQTHTTIGAAVLAKAAKQHPSAVVFFQMAIDIARHHHERYDGAGYPDRLASAAIPLCARIIALADVYDALRSRRTYKPALSHEQTLDAMTKMNTGHFDPVLFQAFLRCAPRLEEIFRQYANDENP